MNQKGRILTKSKDNNCEVNVKSPKKGSLDLEDLPTGHKMLEEKDEI